MSVSLSSQMPACQTAGRRRVLLVAYSFPPVGGAGVQRPAKWVKYLPQFGWDVTVLTPENPSVPLRDVSLLVEIPAETRIVRAKTWEPDYRVKQQLANSPRANRPGLSQTIRGWAKSLASTVLQPDPQVLWVRNAIRAAADELRRVRHDAILVTVPPFSALSIGTALKRRFGLPLVFDFRDEWDLSNRYLEQAPRGWWSQFVQSRMQRSLLRHADAVIATTQASAATYRAKLAAVGNPASSHCIYNGFDPDDFTNVETSKKSSDVFRLVYMGTLWNLTDIEPLVAAIEQLEATKPHALGRLELVCIGRKTAEQQRILDRVRRTNCRVEFRGYCRHEEVAGWLQSADALCLTLADVPGAERVVPAKLFEYLATRKPILGVVPFGESSRLMRQFRRDGHFAPRDVAGIANWLIDRLCGQKYAAGPCGSDELLEQYSRPQLTARLADVLGSVAGRPAATEGSWEQDALSSPLGERCLVGV